MIDIYDRIKETTYTIGTGNFALSGVVQGFSSFSSVYSNSGELFYAVTDGTNYEIGSGLYLSPSNQVKRFPTRSTNSNNLVNFPEGLKEIYVNYPATNAVFSTSGLFPIPQNSGIAFWNSSSSLSYSNKFILDSGNGRIGINKSNPTASIDVGGPSLSSNVKASGFIVGNSGVYFPSGNNGLSSYSGGVQLTHYEMNQTDLYSGSVIQLSGGVNQHILFKKQNAGMVFAGPPSGCSPPCSPAHPNFRILTVEDIPNLSPLYFTLESGNILSSRINAASGPLNSRITAVSGLLNSKIDTLISNSFSRELCHGRLSLSPSQSVFDGSGTSLYFVPHVGNQISLYDYDNDIWKIVTFSSGLVCNFSSLIANSIYDISCSLNGNNLQFGFYRWVPFDPEWEETEFPFSPDQPQHSIRDPNSEIFKYQNIYFVEDVPYRYLGTIKTSNNGFLDTPNRRFVFNAHNRIHRPLKSFVNNTSWSYGSTTYRYIPYASGIELINGLGQPYSLTNPIVSGDNNALVNLEASLSVSLNSLNCGYVLGIKAHDCTTEFRQIVYPYQFSDPSSIVHNFYDHIHGDYQDQLSVTLKARVTDVPTFYQRYYMIEKTKNTNSIVLNSDRYGNYGMIGTYLC
jgi:hypothetical protein